MRATSNSNTIIRAHDTIIAIGSKQAEKKTRRKMKRCCKRDECGSVANNSVNDNTRADGMWLVIPRILMAAIIPAACSHVSFHARSIQRYELGDRQLYNDDGIRFMISSSGFPLSSRQYWLVNVKIHCFSTAHCFSNFLGGEVCALSQSTTAQLQNECRELFVDSRRSLP